MVLLLVIFIPTLAVLLLAAGFGFAFLKSRQKHQIRSMLKNAESAHSPLQTSQLLRPVNDADNIFANLLSRFQITGKLDLFIEQAGMKTSASNIIVTCSTACMICFLVGWKLALFHFPPVSAAALGIVGGLFPILSLMRKRKKNIGEFEKQFPEALDFLSRSMRAGHGFSVALEMLAADSPAPLGPAFQRVSNELALGSSLEVALNKLNTLVPLVDVRFFVSSVLIQQETGGNLGEILSKLSGVIRERFRLKGQVKAASAHGRITGLVLVLMPVGVAVFLMVTNPGYLSKFMDDPMGRILIYAAVGGQILGYFAIRKIVNIKV